MPRGARSRALLHDDWREWRRERDEAAEQAAADDAGAAADPADSEPCFATPWTFTCFKHQDVAGGGGGSGNGSGVIASTATQPTSPISTTVLVLTMTCVGILAVASLLGAYCTVRARRRRQHERALARANQLAERLPKEGAPREVLIPVLVLGPDQTTMHVAFDEESAATCGGSGRIAASNCASEAASSPEPAGCDAAATPQGAAVPGTEAGSVARERQQRRWWQRWQPAGPAAVAEAPPGAADAAAPTTGAPPPPSGAAAPSSPAQPGVPDGNAEDAAQRSASGGGSDAEAEPPGASRSLVRRVWYPASRSVLSVADVAALHAHEASQLAGGSAAGMPAASAGSADARQ